jgi:hypothetical protein
MSKLFKWEKFSNKKMRILLGLTMFYAFLGFVSMFYIFSMVAVRAGVLEALGFFSLWFFQPLALICLTYYLLMNVYSYEEKK